MKKNKIFLIVLSLLLLVGCSNKEKSTKTIDSNNRKNNNINVSQDLKDPVIKWCQLYNPNGFDTITCIISNPNKEDIDITYDLVFYKDGKEVSRQENWSNFQVSSKHYAVIWGNTNIPKSTDVDEVKMENIIVTQSYYESVDAEIKYIETLDNKAYFSVKHDKKPTLNSITFFLYNDNNKNGKCDKGELVVASTASTTEKEDKVYFDTNVFKYTNYEIYYNAY